MCLWTHFEQQPDFGHLFGFMWLSTWYHKLIINETYQVEGSELYFAGMRPRSMV